MPTLQEQLAAAEQRRLDIISGRAATEMRQGDESMKFQPADLAALERHIEDLKTQAGIGRRRAIGVRFR